MRETDLAQVLERFKCCYTAALLLLYCCFTAALLLLYSAAALLYLAQGLEEVQVESACAGSRQEVQSIKSDSSHHPLDCLSALVRNVIHNYLCNNRAVNYCKPW